MMEISLLRVPGYTRQPLRRFLSLCSLVRDNRAKGNTMIRTLRVLAAQIHRLTELRAEDILAGPRASRIIPTRSNSSNSHPCTKTSIRSSNRASRLLNPPSSNNGRERRAQSILHQVLPTSFPIKILGMPLANQAPSVDNLLQ